MVFSEPAFLFLFLPMVLAAYFGAPTYLKNTILLAASLLFYAWGEKLFVLVMLGSIVFNYGLGMAVDRSRGRPKGSRILALGIAGNLIALVVFKYSNFIVDNLNTGLIAVGASPIAIPPVHLPIGISFFTFQAISYLIDIHRRDIEVQRNLLDYAVYKSLFPQLIAGPIVRYKAVEHEIHSRSVGLEDFAAGAQRFVFGLAKKMLIANSAGLHADRIFALSASDLSGPVAWLGIACYTIQIYFDFSGYSDMAIGLGRMLGFRFPENFNYPYSATSITEFWRRWHISLSTWFRDYLYIPLGGNRKGPMRTYVNLLLVFALCGFWHGASWNFLIWGMGHGILLVAERLGLGKLLDKSPRLLRHFYVIAAVMVTWVFFRAATLSQSSDYLAAMLGHAHTSPYAEPLGFFLNVEIVLVLLAGVIGSTSLPSQFAQRFLSRRSVLAQNSVQIATFALLMATCMVLIGAGTYNPFIYFRF